MICERHQRNIIKGRINIRIMHRRRLLEAHMGSELSNDKIANVNIEQNNPTLIEALECFIEAYDFIRFLFAKIINEMTYIIDTKIVVQNTKLFVRDRKIMDSGRIQNPVIK